MMNRSMEIVGLVAVMSVVCGVFIPGFPWMGLLWVSLAASASFWMMRRKAARSTAQVIWDVEAEPVRVAMPLPKQSSDR